MTASAAPGAVAAAQPSSAPPIEVAFPDLSRWAAGNTGIPYVWTFDARERGPHVVVQALTHGNEVCGAIALDRLLDEDLRPARGKLTFVFANVAAYQSFDLDDPFASRCVDEDYNRLWSAEVLDGKRQTRDLARARELRPVIDRADALLDLHSMTDPCPPLSLAGTRDKGLALARAVGVPAYSVIDAGHAAGKRLRDYAFFDEPGDPRAALLVECGQHWERAAPDVAMESTLRFLAHFGTVPRETLVARVGAAAPPAQRAIAIRKVITIATDRFAFTMPVHGMMVVPKAGTTIARDGAATIATPHDDCVLIMPTRRPKVGETAVRLGQFV